jgi:hypothetical protein
MSRQWFSIIALVVLAGCSAAEEPRNWDASAHFACRDYSRLAKDLQGGLVNEPEMRTRVQQILENARLADAQKAPKVADSAQALLAAVTTGTTQEAVAAMKALTDACDVAVWQPEKAWEERRKRK